MSIEAGLQLLHYRLIEKIGEGGMGVVWKALDRTLDREVAIKVLPAVLAGDSDRLARLEREAKLLASLNHPNIATVHGLHEDAGIRFLAMELVEGDDLSKRLARGALPCSEAIQIAKQISEGLEAAHAAGVIHRDLKPANIKVAPDGRVKLLDFGLARAFENASASGSGEVSPTLSPTLTAAGTMAGVVLGTAAYMSPEQARGHPLDARVDVWAFGVVLYEMLSGRSAFKGETVSDTLASVLKLDPDFDALPPGVPSRIRRLVTRCLQKDRKQRLHHIADARIALEETLAGVPDEDVIAARKSRTPERLLWLAAMTLVGAVAATTAWNLRTAPAERPHRKILLALDGADPDDPGLQAATISPGGKRVLYVNGKKVFVRDLDDWNSREITAAQGASLVFWSYDGKAIGFVNDETLSRVSADGSRSSVISELPGSTNGAAWGPDGRILLTGNYSHQVGVYEVSERGGEPKPVLLPQTDDCHYHGLDILPGGRGVLVTVHRGDVMALSVLAEGKLTTLLEMETNLLPQAVYSTSGHVLYTRGGTNEGIWAVPFSVDTLETTGEPLLVSATGGAPSVSRDGTLIYRKFSYNLSRRLVWVNRRGEILDAVGQPREGFDFPTLSPDGGRIAVTAGHGSDLDVWIVDVARGTETRLSSSPDKESEPFWMPDGKRLVYRREADDEPAAAMIANADGSGEPEKLGEGRIFGLSPDGKYLIVTTSGEGSKFDLGYRKLGTQDEPQPIARTAASERRGRVSPDGAYIAYDSDESGRREIYLKRFPSGEGKWQASLDGGQRPHWSPKGDELFWIRDGDLMVVDVRTGPGLTLGAPRRLFSWKPAWMLNVLEFDVASDAQRFVLVAPVDESESPNTVMLVENWSGE